jgi:hypothetical protein
VGRPIGSDPDGTPFAYLSSQSLTRISTERKSLTIAQLSDFGRQV